MVPVEVGGRLIEAVPIVADKVPPAAARVRREIVLARFLGKLAVDQGVRELRLRLAATDTTSEAAPQSTALQPPDQRRTEPVVPAGDAPDADTLALADYDHLSSAQVVSKLAGLDESELDAIEAYERSGRHRRTILGKVEQLRAGQGES